jgi:hypothetical protein
VQSFRNFPTVRRARAPVDAAAARMDIVVEPLQALAQGKTRARTRARRAQADGPFLKDRSGCSPSVPGVWGAEKVVWRQQLAAAAGRLQGGRPKWWLIAACGAQGRG